MQQALETVRIRFDEFEADLRTQELRKDGRVVRLPNQSFLVLATLLRRPGDLVTRDELRQVLWPTERFVDYDQALNTAVNRLREALRDSADQPTYIETLPRRGYRFIAAAEISERRTIADEPPPAPAGTPAVSAAPTSSAELAATDATASLSVDSVRAPQATARLRGSWPLVALLLAVAATTVALLTKRSAPPPQASSPQLLPFTSLPARNSCRRSRRTSDMSRSPGAKQARAAISM